MADCKWAGSDQPRVLPQRHVDGCENERCQGCVPCPWDHCRRCGIEHVSGIEACPDCLADVREDLAEIARMYADLPLEVEHRGVDGEAMNLLGPSADPEAWGWHAASALAGRIVPAGCDAKELDDLRQWLAEADGDTHPLWVSGTWAMVYTDALEHDTDEELTVATATAYLDRHLTEAGRCEDVPFDEFTRALARCRTRMEQVLHDGEQVERGAPCPECSRPLRREYGKQAKDDEWQCLNRHCDVTGYTTTQYRGWVEHNALTEATALTAAQMAKRFVNDKGEPRVKAGEVRVWGTRGLVSKRGRTGEGLTLYDVAQVEARLDERKARRIA